MTLWQLWIRQDGGPWVSALMPSEDGAALMETGRQIVLSGRAYRWAVAKAGEKPADEKPEICGHTDPAALELIEADARSLLRERLVADGCKDPDGEWAKMSDGQRNLWRVMAANPISFTRPDR